MSDEQNGHGMSRLDRMEGLMELLIEDHVKFRDEHKSLLTSQILLTDRVDRLAATTGNLAETVGNLTEKMDMLAETVKQVAEAQKELSASQKELSEAQKHTDERMNALIAVLDDLIRRRPN
jgi:methyl-accepting chemotaxis protein